MQGAWGDKGVGQGCVWLKRYYTIIHVVLTQPCGIFCEVLK